MDYPENQDAPSKPVPAQGLQERIAQVYYKHGLMCSSHPIAFIIITLIITAICCYPLVNVPVLSSSYQKFSVPVQDFIQPSPPSSVADQESAQDVIGPRWYQGPPVGFVQQIIVKSAVTPWTKNLMLMDAIRSPLNEVFDIVELVSNHQLTTDKNSTYVSLNELCLQIGEPIDKLASSVLPRYSCLMVSPANIWKLDRTRFHQDSMLIKSIFSQKDTTSDSVSLKEVLFGVPWRETGIKRLYVRTRQRICTYAITVVFKDLNFRFMETLEVALHKRYPLNSYPDNVTRGWSNGSIFHLHFQDQYTWAEFIPLGVAYVMLFLYIYFSFRKMDLVKSKWALAVSSVITVVMSLFMSVGLCLWFGLNLTLNGSEVLPYLVVIVGLENMLVLTKSVVSTPSHLDVKVRVAQGLSKEGWSITKNLFTELALLTFAFLTFVPIIQEFCLIAAVGVLSDFFLQLSFFATMLSFDIHRAEGEELQREPANSAANFHSTPEELSLSNVGNNFQKDLKVPSHLLRTRLGNQRMRSPMIPYGNGHYPATVFALSSTPILVKVPKRLRFIYFWARTRMVQKGLMVCLVVWISLLLYKSGIVEHLADNTTNLMPAVLKEQVVNPLQSALSWRKNSTAANSVDEDETTTFGDAEVDHTDASSKLIHRNLELWEGISSHHWMALFGYYNISLHGKFLSILPSIHISIPVNPQTAVENRHVTESDANVKSPWPFPSQGDIGQDTDDLPEISYHPSSPAEVALALALAIPSIVFIVYVLIMLYRCMCSRHYAEWRSSWWQQHVGKGRAKNGMSPYSESDAHQIMESIPIKLQGHKREVEHMSTDGNFVVSSCLAGDVRVWDPLNGECIAMVQRSRPVPSQASYNKVHTFKKAEYQTHRPTGSVSSDSNYSSSPTSDFGDHGCLSPHFATMPRAAPSQSHHTSNENSSSCETTQSSKAIYCTGSYGRPSPSHGYDFSRFMQCKDDSGVDGSQQGANDAPDVPADVPENDLELRGQNGEAVESEMRIGISHLPYQPIWCLDSQGSHFVVGCGGGRMEVWDISTGTLCCYYDDCHIGITSIRIIGNRIIVARLNGVLEFFQLQIVSSLATQLIKHHNYSDQNIVEHSHEVLHMEMCGEEAETAKEHVHCIWLNSLRAHSQPITVIEVNEGHVVTGSLDHWIKVFRCDTASSVYTLHGHFGGITALHIDKGSSTTNAVSGCQAGTVCVWDLMTGTCVFNFNTHRGAVTAVLATDTYVISAGDDSCICIWEKYQGHLLNTIPQHHTFATNMVLLTANIIITANNDNLVLWDLNQGEPLKMLSLGSGDQNAHIKNMRKAHRAVVCDCGKCLYVIHFPAVTEKRE